MRPHAPPYLKACSSCRAKCSSRSGVAPPDCAAESAVRRASASWPCASASWPRSLQHSSARRVAPEAAGHAPGEGRAGPFAPGGAGFRLNCTMPAAACVIKDVDNQYPCAQ